MQAILYFDGSLRRGIMHGGYIVFVFTNPMIIGSGSESLPLSPASNDCEWFALLSGLKWVTKIRGLEKVLIRGDSLSVLEGLNKTFKFKNKISKSYQEECIKLLGDHNIEWAVEKIDRSHNVFAHRLNHGLEPFEKSDNYHPAKNKILQTLAKSFWKQAGKPKGRDLEFWTQAEQLFFESMMPPCGVNVIPTE